VDFFSQSCTTEGFVAFDVTQVKEQSYCNQHHIDQFLHLTNEVFNCLHKHANVLLHNCANAIWSLKKPKGLHLSILVIFFLLNFFNHITKYVSILHLKLSDRLIYFPTSSLSRKHPITMANLLQAINF